MKQTILTIITSIETSKRKELENILAEIRADLYGNGYIPFPKLSLLHFASFVIIDHPDREAQLIFENNFDGDVSGYIDQLLNVAVTGLNHIYQCCKSYQPQHLKSFLMENIVLPNAYHIGNVGRRANDVSNNRQLRLKLEGYLDQLFSSVKPAGFPPAELRKNIQGFVQTLDVDLSGTLPPHQTLSEKVAPYINVVLAALLFFVLFPLALIALLVLRFKENGDPADTAPADISHVDLLMSTENQITQNHLASITMIKPGLFRLNLLRVVLFAANLLARTSNKGKLSGIPSIHFAHWSIINNTQLLFLSNFDGSWSSYLDDFIDKASRGLTGVWSNTAGFPKTRFLVLGGATDELRFKAFARSMQVPSQVWYSAYPDMTVQNIDKDSAIRENVLTTLSEADTEQWLKLF